MSLNRGVMLMTKSVVVRLRLLSAVFALLTVGLSHAAQAAPSQNGCTGINSGSFDGTGSFFTRQEAGFAAGDTLNLTITTTAVASFNLRATSGPTIDTINFSGAASVSRSYTLTAAQLDLTEEASITGTVGSITVVATCTPAARGASARAIQIAGSRAAAQASGHAITGSVSGAIQQLLSNNPSPGVGADVAGFAPPSNLATASLPAPSALGGPLPRDDGGGYEARPRESLATAPSRWRAWADLRGTDIRDEGSSTVGPRGSQTNFTFGVGTRLDNTSGAGALGGYEHFSYDFGGAGRLRGNGGTIGAYAGTLLLPRLMLDAVAAYTALQYDVAGASSGSFDANRWLGSIGLTGSFDVYGPVLLVEPMVRVYMLHESQEGWVDNLGAPQASRDFTEGRVSLGAKLVARLPSPHGLFAPYLGLYGEYDFSSDNALPAGTLGLGLNEGWSMRAVSGMTLTMDHGIVLSLGGEFGGIGADVTTRTLRIGVAAPL
jgi:hypothetical protein